MSDSTSQRCINLVIHTAQNKLNHRRPSKRCTKCLSLFPPIIRAAQRGIVVGNSLHHQRSVCVQKCLNSCSALVSNNAQRRANNLARFACKLLPLEWPNGAGFMVVPGCWHMQRTLERWCDIQCSRHCSWAVPQPKRKSCSRKQDCPSSHRVIKQNMRTGATRLASGRVTPPSYLELRLLSIGAD